MLSQDLETHEPASPDLELEVAYWALVGSFHYLFGVTLLLSHFKVVVPFLSH